VAERPIVLVAASQPAVRRLVTASLKARGFTVAGTPGHELAPDVLVDRNPDVVVVDAPGASASTRAALQAVAAADRVPVIVLSEASTPTDAIRALDAGADDYVPRPFDPTELAARVRSLVRRRGARLASGRRRIGRSEVDFDLRQIRRDGRVISLGRSDWRLLLRLMADEDRVVSQDDLLAAAYGSTSRGDLAPLRASVARLRRKLGAGPRDEGPIETARGIGYRLVVDTGLRTDGTGSAPAGMNRRPPDDGRRMT